MTIIERHIINIKREAAQNVIWLNNLNLITFFILMDY